MSAADGRGGDPAAIRDFLATRRAKLTPDQVGLPSGGRRRVPGLRREEVAVLAGVSTDWYARLEKGHVGEVSDDVLAAVARALQLDEAETIYLFDLARAARPARRAPSRRREVELPARTQWMLDSITMSAAFVRDGRLDVVATNALARALHAPMFDSPTTRERGRANFARFHFLDPTAHQFFVDWDAGARTTVALLRTEAGREPRDRALRELIGELVTQSDAFRVMWSDHDVLIRHDGLKRFRHPDVGPLDLTYQSLQLPTSDSTAHDLTTYTAEPGSPHEERLRLLASWNAVAPDAPRPSPAASD